MTHDIRECAILERRGWYRVVVKVGSPSSKRLNFSNIRFRLKIEKKKWR